MTAPIPTVMVDHVDLTRDVYLNIADGPVIVKQYGARKFRVTRVHIEYRQIGEEAWQWTGLGISGPFVKNDGTDGVSSNRDHFYRMQDVAERGFWSLVEQHMPGAAL